MWHSSGTRVAPRICFARSYRRRARQFVCCLHDLTVISQVIATAISINIQISPMQSYHGPSQFQTLTSNLRCTAHCMLLALNPVALLCHLLFKANPGQTVTQTLDERLSIHGNINACHHGNGAERDMVHITDTDTSKPP